MLNELGSLLMPGDAIGADLHPHLESNYYQHYADLVQEFGVKSVVEIGVRAGYTAFAMMTGNPELDYVGYDIDTPNDYGYIEGGFDYAYEMLNKQFPNAKINLLRKDTQRMKTLGKKQFDLAHIDGNQSFEGVMNDLRLCEKNAGMLLVDDYDFAANVKAAVDKFLEDTGYQSRKIDTFRGMVLIFVK